MMVEDEFKKFEAFLRDSFQEGTSCRELRLSQAEKDYIENQYPGARLKKLVTQEYADQKSWYEVKIGGHTERLGQEIEVES